MSSENRRLHRFLQLALAVLGVLVAGLAVRRLGITHGSPDLIFHPDVSKQALVAEAVSRGQLDLRRLFRDNFELTIYPYGSAVLAGSLWRLSGVSSQPRESAAGARWRWALKLRYFSLALFLAAVGLLLIVRAPAAGPLATLLTGLLLVLEPLNAQHGHYGMNDVPMVGLLLLTWLAAGTMERERVAAPLGSLLAGLALGLASGVKYQAALGGVFLLVAWAGVWQRGGVRGLLASALASATGLAAGLSLTMPMLVQDPAYFLRTLPQFLAWQSNVLGEPLSLTGKALRNARTLLGLLASSFGWVLCAGIAAGMIRGVASPPASRQRLSALLFCALLGATLVLGRDFVRSNDVLPLLAFAVVLFGDCLAAPRGETAHRGRRICLAAAVGLVGVFSTVSIRDGLALGRTDTRVLARDWCRQNLPAPAVLLRERNTLPVAREGVDELEVRHLARVEAQQLIEHGVADYVILSALTHERYTDPASPSFNESVAGHYRRLRAAWDEVAVFTDRKLIYAHPEIRVLRRPLPQTAPVSP